MVTDIHISRLVLILTCVSLTLYGCNIAQQNYESVTPSDLETNVALESTQTTRENSDFDAFVQQSFYDLLIRDPETVLELGLGHQFGIEGCELTNVSAEYIAETQQIESTVLNTLHLFNFEQLTPEQQRTYNIYEWYLDDLVRGHDYQYFDYPVNQMIIGVQNDVYSFLTDLYQINDREDAEGYIACLSQVDEKFDQVIDSLEVRANLGIVLPEFLIDWVVSGLDGIINSDAVQTEFYTTYVDRLQPIWGIDASVRSDLLQQAVSQIEESVIPAYRALRNELNSLRDVASNTIGLWQYPGGDDAYQHYLRHFTTTEMSPEDIHTLGLTELERIHTEMQVLFDQLNYPPNANLTSNYYHVMNDGGFLSNSEIREGYQDLIEDAPSYFTSVFNRLPQANVEVWSDPVGGYYVPPAMDGSRPGIFFASISGGEAEYGMPTLAYHEAIPGHHLQLALASELDLPLFQRVIVFTGYVEGWALYAERLMAELGAYQDNIYGDLGRLQAEARRAARLVADTGIHAFHWTYDETVDFMVENTGLPHQLVEYEVARMVVWPGQADSYYIGFMRILEMRSEAEQILGSQFNLADFHSAVLENGSMPLDLLENEVQRYIASAD